MPPGCCDLRISPEWGGTLILQTFTESGGHASNVVYVGFFAARPRSTAQHPRDGLQKLRLFARGELCPHTRIRPHTPACPRARPPASVQPRAARSRPPFRRLGVLEKRPYRHLN